MLKGAPDAVGDLAADRTRLQLGPMAMLGIGATL
jgi:hypothetical protein